MKKTLIALCLVGVSLTAHSQIHTGNAITLSSGKLDERVVLFSLSYDDLWTKLLSFFGPDKMKSCGIVRDQLNKLRGLDLTVCIFVNDARD